MAKAPYHRGEELFVVLNITKGIPFAFFAFFTSRRDRKNRCRMFKPNPNEVRGYPKLYECTARGEVWTEKKEYLFRKRP